MTHPRSQVIEAFMPSWAKEKGVGIWGFKEEEDNSQEDGKSQRLGTNVCLATQMSLLGIKILSGNSSLPGTDPLSKFF